MQETWQTLRGELDPTKVMLDLSDQLLGFQPLPHRLERLKDATQAALPLNVCRNGVPVEVEALGDFIGDLLLSKGLIRGRLSVALPAAAAQWRVLSRVPTRWPDDPLDWVRKQHADLDLPFPLDQAYLDVLPLRGGEPQALVVACERQLMQSWLEVFSIAGVQMDRMVPSQLAVMAGLRKRLQVAESGSLVALLQPELDAFRLLVWHRGVPLYERLIGGDAAAQVEELSRCLAFLRMKQRLPETAPCALLLDTVQASAQSKDQLEALRGELVQRSLVLEPASTEGYGSLALHGLALLEGVA